MKFYSKETYTKLLISCILLLSIIFSLITFSEGGPIPTWKQIGIHLGIVDTETISDDYVRFLDVGQGDSILISSNGHNAMIDFGNNTGNGRELIAKLNDYAVDDFDCIFMTHYDSDHIGGADAVLDRYDVDNVVLPKSDGEKSAAYRQVNTALKNSDANIVVAQTGKLITVGDFNLEIVGYYKNEDESNDRSLIILATIDDKKFLFSGDAGTKIENKLMSEKKNLDCDVFKASHHGSNSANSYNFLKYITPEYCVISCGSNNSYGHPHENVLNSLEKVNSDVYRTDLEGDITFYIKEQKIIVDTEIK